MAIENYKLYQACIRSGAMKKDIYIVARNYGEAEKLIWSEKHNPFWEFKTYRKISALKELPEGLVLPFYMDDSAKRRDK